MGQGSAARQGGTVREATVDLLRELGMTTVFGNPGSTEIPFLGEWPNSLRYVLGLQEASVVAMADGYARASGRAAFCNLHSAAGVGHALGNVFTAHRNNAPLVITAGQQARALLPHQPFLGATDAAQFPKPYVKWSAEPARAEDVPAAIAQAWRVATQRPRGPAFVSIPVDDWARPAGTLAPPRPALSDPAPDPAVLAELAAALGRGAAPGAGDRPRGGRGRRRPRRRGARGAAERARLGQPLRQPPVLSRGPPALRRPPGRGAGSGGGFARRA